MVQTSPNGSVPGNEVGEGVGKGLGEGVGKGDGMGLGEGVGKGDGMGLGEGGGKEGRTVPRAAVATAVAIILVLLAMAVWLTQCAASVDKEAIHHQYSQINSKYEFSTGDIALYELIRLNDSLKASGLVEYEEAAGGLRDYPYTAEDYARIDGLDDTYLYGFHKLATKEDVDEMAKAIGYDDLDDFMRSKGFMDSDGRYDTRTWAAYTSVEIARIVDERGIDIIANDD